MWQDNGVVRAWEDMPQTDHKKEYRIWTDGSYKKEGNIETYGWGAVLAIGNRTVHQDKTEGHNYEDTQWVDVAWRKIQQHVPTARTEGPSNNTEELHAVIFVLKQIKTWQPKYKDAIVKLHIDSEYVIDLIKGDKVPTANKEIVKQAVTLLNELNVDRRLPIEITHVKSHAGDVGNMIADIVAGETTLTKVVMRDWQRCQGMQRGQSQGDTDMWYKGEYAGDEQDNDNKVRKMVTFWQDKTQ